MKENVRTIIRNIYMSKTNRIPIVAGMAGAMLISPVNPLAGLIIIGILAVFLLIQEPKLMLFLLIFSFPLEVVSYYHGITFKLWMIILAIGVFMWILDVLRGKRGIANDLIIAIFAFIVIVELISVTHAVNLSRWLRMLVQYSILFVLSIYIASILDSRKKYGSQ